MFVGDRIYRSDAHGELANRTRKSADRLRRTVVRGDVYAFQTSKTMDAAVQRYLLEARDSGARNSSGAGSSSTLGLQDDSDAKDRLSSEPWNRSSLSPEMQEFCTEVALTQDWVSRSMRFLSRG